jgi:hypothetical protein
VTVVYANDRIESKMVSGRGGSIAKKSVASLESSKVKGVGGGEGKL